MRTCALCGTELPPPTAEEEAEMRAELAELWPGVPLEECDVTCDACFESVHPSEYPTLYEETLDHYQQ